MPPADDDKNDPPKTPPQNPWDRNAPENNRPGGPWKPNGPGGRNTPPDFNEMLRRLRARFNANGPQGSQGPQRRGFEGKAAVLIAGAVIALWLLSGFYLVSPGENAVITRFGKWSQTQTDPGLGYRLPWPIDAANIINVTVDRRIQIGFAEGAGGHGGKQDIPEESLMLTADANIVDLDLVVLWNIDNARDYAFTVRDQEETIKKVAQSALREIVGQTDLQPIITGNRNQVAVEAQKIMQDTLDAYKSGVSIKQVIIQDATVHPDVIDAYEDVVAATQDAERFQNEANIYRNDIVPKARGQAAQITQQAEAYKQSVVTKAEGDAARFNAVYAAYLNGKDVTRSRLYIETMEDVLGAAQKIIVDRSAAGAGVVPYLPLSELKPAAGASASNAPSASGADDDAAAVATPPQPSILSGRAAGKGK